jgi:hypothetical protein
MTRALSPLAAAAARYARTRVVEESYRRGFLVNNRRCLFATADVAPFASVSSAGLLLSPPSLPSSSASRLFADMRTRSSPTIHEGSARRRGVASSAGHSLTGVSSGAGGAGGAGGAAGGASGGACVARSDGSFERIHGNPSNDEWLASMPRGAYINARTFRRDSIYQFDYHMQKLVGLVGTFARTVFCSQNTS